MPGWVIHDGHIGWAVFTALVYTGVLLLVIDYVWRRLTLSFVGLAAGAIVIWSVGIILLALTL